MTSTAILSPPIRGLVADTELGVPRTQMTEAETPLKAGDKGSTSNSLLSAEAKPTTNATVRRTTIDWETGSVVFRVIDEHSGQTLSQSPEEALLRLRAYARQNETIAETAPEQPAPGRARTEKTV